MKIKVYQINLDRDTNRVWCMSYEYVKSLYGIDRSIYDCVFEGNVEVDGLEDIFYIFNFDKPEGYKGTSMTVSDIVEVEGKGAYFCDNVGWRELK